MTERCSDCGLPITESHKVFVDQWEPSHEEVCYPHVNFGGQQLCAERTSERLRKQLDLARKCIEAADRGMSMIGAGEVWERYYAARAELARVMDPKEAR